MSQMLNSEAMTAMPRYSTSSRINGSSNNNNNNNGNYNNNDNSDSNYNENNSNSNSAYCSNSALLVLTADNHNEQTNGETAPLVPRNSEQLPNAIAWRRPCFQEQADRQ
jgi:hypothetical protein